jgi:hypothetical protein
MKPVFEVQAKDRHVTSAYRMETTLKFFLVTSFAMLVLITLVCVAASQKKSREYGGLIPDSELEAKTKSADELAQQWQESEEAKRSLGSFDSVFQGTSETKYGRDWVMVDDVKLSGITTVKSAPGAHARVTIVCSEGEKLVSANQLPQGFLSAWGVTPALLKAANDQ